MTTTTEHTLSALTTPPSAAPAPRSGSALARMLADTRRCALCGLAVPRVHWTKQDADDGGHYVVVTGPMLAVLGEVPNWTPDGGRDDEAHDAHLGLCRDLHDDDRPA